MSAASHSVKDLQTERTAVHLGIEPKASASERRNSSLMISRSPCLRSSVRRRAWAATSAAWAAAGSVVVLVVVAEAEEEVEVIEESRAVP
jgi:hypothetical protein